MRAFNSRSFRGQLVLTAVVVTVVGVIVLTVIVQIVLARATDHSVDTVLEDRAETVVGSISRGPTGNLIVPDDRLDAGVAVYGVDGQLAAGTIPRSERSIYADLSTTASRRIVHFTGSGESRVLAEPFTTDDGATGVVVVTERLAPYETAEQRALLVCIGAGVLMVAMAAGLVQWISRRALVPVAEMAGAADDWSEHDLAHRFNPGPGRNEIAALGRTLDRLLERVATAIRSEQRLTAELAHELRTPLAAIQANADLALNPDEPTEAVRNSLIEIAEASRRMSETIEGLLELARTDTGQALSGSCNLRDAVVQGLGALDAGGVDINVDATIRVGVPEALAVRAISPVLANAVRLAEHVVVSSRDSRDGYVDLFVDDDGPGIQINEQGLIFDPGHTTGTGAGLGLPLARRVARSMGGDVRLSDGPMVTRLVVTLPSAQRS